MVVTTEHDAVDDEHTRLEERVDNRRKGETPDFRRESQLTIRSL